MWKKLSTLCFIGGLALFTPGWLKGSSSQSSQDIWADNNCVSCHAKVTAPLSLSNKYFEWHISLHRDNSVGCEKCHGGDPTTKDTGKAHQQALPAADQQSKIHPANLPETCSACHNAVVKSFIESEHYQKLKGSGMGPSCTTCHAHMASAVVQTPTETAALCARCHNTVDGLLPPRPEIPEKAKDMMEALNRANTMVVWADRLLEVGQQKNLTLTEESAQLKSVKALLSEAQVSWHALGFGAVRKKADESFELGTKVKDQLMKKLYPQPTQ